MYKVRAVTLKPKPEWIKVRLPGGPTFNRISHLLKQRNLHTVCEEAKCPNIAECWGGGTATIMLMGDTCTRGCRFCAVTSGHPEAALDPLEPQKAAETVGIMNLDYVVITSVNRDDLPDGGSSHFAKTIHEVRKKNPETLIEVLIPDFKGSKASLDDILRASPHVIAHNIETVRRLTPEVRDPRATYDQSLDVLRYLKSQNPQQRTKSSIMLGVGETSEEIVETLEDLRAVGVEFLTLGQYLQPTKKHLEVKAFIDPTVFKFYEKIASDLGFRYVASGPLVRSSYRAGEFYMKSLLKGESHGL